jgi:hypothetical protein
MKERNPGGEGHKHNNFNQENQNWFDKSHEELVDMFKSNIQNQRAEYKERGLNFDPVEWVSQSLVKHTMSGSDIPFDANNPESFSCVNHRALRLERAWDAITFPYINDESYKDIAASIVRDYAATDGRTVNLDPKAVKLLDAMTDALNIPHKRGESTVDLLQNDPEQFINMRYTARTRADDKKHSPYDAYKQNEQLNKEEERIAYIYDNINLERDTETGEIRIFTKKKDENNENGFANKHQESSDSRRNRSSKSEYVRRTDASDNLYIYTDSVSKRVYPINKLALLKFANALFDDDLENEDNKQKSEFIRKLFTYNPQPSLNGAVAYEDIPDDEKLRLVDAVFNTILKDVADK